MNQQQTIWFDTTYAYIWSGTQFQEFIPGTTWASTDSDFFWGFNYRGTNPQDRLFFVTNFVNTASNPIRYTDGVTWTTFVPLISATQTLFQARIIIAYYGRLLALNTWEGSTAGGAGAAVNIYNRCRFSQLGNPVDQTNAWRTDVFGRGGFLDAPVNEQITGATFIKNTLVVDFENTTWQLRYVGDMECRSFGKGFPLILGVTLHFLVFFLIIIVFLWEIRLLQLLLPQEWIELISTFQIRYSTSRMPITSEKSLRYTRLSERTCILELC